MSYRESHKTPIVRFGAATWHIAFETEYDNDEDHVCAATLWCNGTPLVDLPSYDQLRQEQWSTANMLRLATEAGVYTPTASQTLQLAAQAAADTLQNAVGTAKWSAGAAFRARAAVATAVATAERYARDAEAQHEKAVAEQEQAQAAFDAANAALVAAHAKPLPMPTSSV